MACEHSVELVATLRWEKKRDVLPEDFTRLGAVHGFGAVVPPRDHAFKGLPRMVSTEEATIAAGNDAESRPHW